MQQGKSESGESGRRTNERKNLVAERGDRAGSWLDLDIKVNFVSWAQRHTHTNHGGLAAAKMSRALDLLRDGIWILESDRTKECFFAPREIIEKCSSRESLQFICRHTFVLPSPACERNSWLDHYRPRQPSDLHATGSPIVVVVVVFVWLLSPQNLRSSSFV